MNQDELDRGDTLFRIVDLLNKLTERVEKIERIERRLNYPLLVALGAIACVLTDIAYELHRLHP